MKTALRLLLVALALYALGFALFLAALPSPRVGVPAVPGLVVFTGGSNRIGMAMDALDQGYTGPVLISGVNKGVTIHQLEPDLSASEAEQIELDTAALTTRQNVDNTAAWAVRHGLTQVGIITSTYHTARVKLLFAWRAPQLQLEFIPVQPNEAGLKALLREYNKLLAAPIVAETN